MLGFVLAIQIFLPFWVCRCERRCGLQGFVLAIQVFLLFLGVSLRVVVQNAVFCARDTGFSAV